MISRNRYFCSRICFWDPTKVCWSCEIALLYFDFL